MPFKCHSSQAIVTRIFWLRSILYFKFEKLIVCCFFCSFFAGEIILVQFVNVYMEDVLLAGHVNAIMDHPGLPDETKTLPTHVCHVYHMDQCCHVCFVLDVNDLWQVRVGQQNITHLSASLRSIRRRDYIRTTFIVDPQVIRSE